MAPSKLNGKSKSPLTSAALLNDSPKPLESSLTLHAVKIYRQDIEALTLHQRKQNHFQNYQLLGIAFLNPLGLIHSLVRTRVLSSSSGFLLLY